MLARYVKDGETEFVFVNSQWEDMSYGVLDLAALYLDDLIDKTKLQDYFTSHLRHITLDIMNRIQRDLNARYDGDLFINYTSDLTVEKARGHIILMESSHDSNCSKKNPQCNYLFGWPDKDCHYAKICAFDKKDAISRNLYVQSHYEMCLSDDDSISLKKTDVRKVASEVAKRNYNGEGILGFNAMNANTGNGYDLDVYEFAHIFNGDAFNMYVENMKNATKGKDRYYGGIVSMDHLGVHRYVSLYRTGLPVDVYGDYLTWAVIESNFYVKK